MPKIKVRSIPETFRRAGIVFSKNAAEYDVDKKTLATLQAEPMLVVEILPEEKRQDDSKPKDKKDPGEG